MAWKAPPVIAGVVAVLVLLGATMLAVLGVIGGEDAVSLYAIVLGYVFGVQVGHATNGHNGGR